MNTPTPALHRVAGEGEIPQPRPLSRKAGEGRGGGGLAAIDLTVNGTAIAETVEPRLHLADFLRERLLLTGTHLGCEHGVCGACTILLDGEPARSCIAYAADCTGRVVETIEGLDQDPVIAALRAAFTADHALQCGYCTPGMLVTARDIVRRLPDIDDDGIRLELAGNLCRCTGYNGIVRAIRRVLDQRLPDIGPDPLPAVPQGRFVRGTESVAAVPLAAVAGGGKPGTLTQSIRLAVPVDQLWEAVRDPALIAGCVPGVRLTSIENGRIAGEMVASLGPIQARFAGTATIAYEEETRSGRIAGQGRDQASGTRLSADAGFTVAGDGPDASTLQLDMSYTLQGPLAQFSRGPIVQVFAAEIAATVGRTLQARLRGEAEPAEPATLKAGGLALRVFWRWLGSLVPRRNG